MQYAIGPLLTAMLAAVPLLLLAAWAWRHRDRLAPRSSRARADALDHAVGLVAASDAG